MKGLSSLERIVLETLDKNSLNFEEVHFQTGLQENVCYNIIQALIIRGLISTDGICYQRSKTVSPILMDEVNGLRTKQLESLELIEAVVERCERDHFRFKKIAIDSRDEKIFMAMLSNLESFLVDAHKKAQHSIPLKERKVIFWGVGQVQTLMNHILTGK